MAGKAKTAIIIGGGIGGLTTAIALRRKGIEAAVYERAPEIREVGAGLTLWANAVKALGKLGLAEAVKAAGAPGMGGSIRTWQGDVLSSLTSEELERRYGAANLGIHRADLQRILLDRLGEEVVHLGATCSGFSQDEDGVTVRFEDGREARADVLIGADGIHSTVRAQLFGKEKPRYSGYTAWRGVVELPDAGQRANAAFETWGCGQRFGHVTIGQGRVYWFAVRNTRPGETDAPQGRQAEVGRLFADWHAPIPALIAATAEAAILRNDIYDREPLKRWSEGRVTLLGDAAHAMTPNLGQGACQAIEDAVVLANRLAERDDAAQALLAYEMARIQRANLIVTQSWRIGRVAQWGNPLACAVRNTLFKTLGGALQGPQLNFILGYEVR
ncbi:MAG: FAD-dependent monooxygenase [Anaerolineae bacterium]|nr:FAD-dependent monooxygenase [Anaerolineae bacterium]